MIQSGGTLDKSSLDNIMMEGDKIGLCDKQLKLHDFSLFSYLNI